jgi:hypothetical protein
VGGRDGSARLAPASRDASGRVARSYLEFPEARGIAVLDEADGRTDLVNALNLAAEAASRSGDPRPRCTWSHDPC